MADEPAMAIRRSCKKSSTAYDAATRKNDACPKHSDTVNVCRWGDIHRGMGISRGVFKTLLILSTTDGRRAAADAAVGGGGEV
eukprot:CAMPEP_0113511136 /NCGR_PEP_ID=MMETSP0014_2-20120614/38535_1 /TAXON_ID=2857 /ORGANISM="Nitzschia sp." /LENGTH=82 /DNA_ID=CAMNT_0000407187 /DNA_START=13 /DNA_END=261 /DNA_ORIENTATION=- /assembly_acc=CAM_ASM_000159